MFAVIKTGGKQVRVQEGDILDIEKLEQEEGQKVTFDKVLLIEDDKNTLIGTPIVEKAQVVGEVIENFKDKKILVFKKKRRKQYRKTIGHRQWLTRVRIEKIVLGTESPKKEASAEKKPTAAVKEGKPEAQAAKKKPAEKKGKPKTAEQAKAERKTAGQKAGTKKTGAKKLGTAKIEEKPAAKTAAKKKTEKEKQGVKKAAEKQKKTTSKKEK